MPVIRQGACHALFAYEIAYAIDLEAAQRRLAAAHRQPALAKRRAPSSFEYRPAPLRLAVDAEPIRIGDFTTSPVVDLILYDFGAVSVRYDIPLAGPLEALPALAMELFGNTQLLADSRRRVEEVLAALGDAAKRPRLADFEEDYVIFEIQSFDGPVEPEQLCTAEAGTVARILRAETARLSQQVVHDVCESRLSFAADDVLFIDADAALLYDREGEEVLAVLELANTQLLEMRHLDQQLDDALDEAYEMASAQRTGKLALPGGRESKLRRLAELQLDSALLFEQVTNALKLIGDQYLSRVYSLVSRRFQIAQWDDSINRKLGAIDSIYAKMMDRAATRRMEVLEWIIIILIAVSIVLPFIPGYASK